MNRYVAITAAVLMTAGSMQTEAMEVVDGLTIGGDMRLRHETIHEDGKDDRDRQRMRARLKLGAKVTDTVKADFRLASGSDDPVSSNQSLDGGFGTKDFRLDRAYLTWTPEAFSGFDGTLFIGKMAQPFVVIKDLIWDGDFNPEGAAFQASAGVLQFTAAAWIAEERSSDAETYVASAQLVGNFNIGESKLLLGATYYDWANMKGYELLFDTEDSFGNSTIEDAEGALSYAEDFGQAELLAKWSGALGLPVSVYADYVINNDADGDQDTAYMVGATFGKAKDPGSYQLDYNFREVEADAVVAAYSDSDAFGGGSDGEGHKLQFKYQMEKNWQFAATYFFENTIGIQDGGSDTDYERFQIDLVAKF